ncbi:MAG: glucuronate isomerase [Bryobacteraceae bacterium]|nr:glucuronate isomerase [Bryobacteraceae bacterium]
MTDYLRSDQVLLAVQEQLQSLQVVDMHTHLFMPSLGSLGLSGIDELVTYHYLEAELFRSNPIQPAQYWALPRQQQADLIWKTLFVENPPISEATRGVVAVLQAFGLPTTAPDLVEARRWFAARTPNDHLTEVLRLAGVSDVVMTNDPLDPAEGPEWRKEPERDPRFHPVLRLDRILNKWADHWKILDSQGYLVSGDASGRSVGEVRRFLDEWCYLMKPVYMAVSLPDSFAFPENSLRAKLLDGAVLPACRDHGIPLSLMIGVRYLVNPALRLAGDASGVADLRALEYLCREYPDNRFLVSLLSRENQHELCVYARKFGNLMPFGCWWFLNNPSIVEEITRERIEMLGASFIPQHSDARVLEQLIYKWKNTRRTLAPILADTYQKLTDDGRAVSRDEIKQDVDRMFRNNFLVFVRNS